MRRFIVRLLALGLSLALLLGTYLAVDPVGFRRHVFQPVRELRLLCQELDVVRSWPDVRRIVLPEPQTVVLEGGGVHEPSLAADIYRSQTSSAPAPAMLLLHGSAPWGRKAGLIRLLGTRLAGQGWIVLAPDARGFGGSGHPADSIGIHAWDASKDVQRSLAHLVSLPGVDVERVYVLGHSMGANQALEGALGDPRVRGLILVGPSRYDLDQFSPLQQWWQRVRFAADRKLSRPLDADVMVHVLESNHLTRFLGNGLTTRGAQGILLVDGALEGDWNLDFLEEYAQRIHPPVEHKTLPNTGHYCGVWNFWGSEAVWYRPDLFDPFFDLVMEFTKKGGQRPEDEEQP